MRFKIAILDANCPGFKHRRARDALRLLDCNCHCIPSICKCCRILANCIMMSLSICSGRAGMSAATGCSRSPLHGR
jgi:hypothetical protein